MVKTKLKHKKEKITFGKEWNLADNIKTKEDVIGILEAALEHNDTAYLFSVIGDIAKSQGMAELARELNLNRESLYKSLSSEGNPSFNTVAKVLDNFGLQLSVREKIPA